MDCAIVEKELEELGLNKEIFLKAIKMSNQDWKPNTYTLGEYWEALGNVPVNEDMEIEDEFHNYPIGTEIYDIWHDIEEQWGIAIHTLLYKQGHSITDES
jgi:hypothetical protein